MYFHKEVSFDTKRNVAALHDETFWIVRKSGLESRIESHDCNPVSTSYEMLWREVQNQNRSKESIQNTLRRILEHYFKILGGLDYDKICDFFEGNDKYICKSLFSWVHAGSHGVLDDLHVANNDFSMDAYLRVFREIFVKCDHESHYRMMMGLKGPGEQDEARAA